MRFVRTPGLTQRRLGGIDWRSRSAGAERLAREARIRAESGGGAPWAARTLPIAQYG